MVQLLGVKINKVSLAVAWDKIKGFLVDGQQHYVVTVNTDFLVRAQNDKVFREILNQADLSVADGSGVVLAAKLLSQSLEERISGVDLMSSILNQDSGIRENVFLLGGRHGVAAKIAGRYENVIGFTENLDEAVNLINRCQPQILFVALSSPKQEQWIAQNLSKVPSVKLAMGVGGAFNFLAGRVRRAPKFLRSLGLEWLWRTLREPWRWRQVWRSLVFFPIIVIKQKLLMYNSYE